MADYSWIEKVEDLSPAALTVRAQALSPTDGGVLRWPLFFPRQDVEFTDLADVMTLDKRFVADRREWNGPGRFIPMATPDVRKIEIIPIESYDVIAEKEMQKLREQTRNNQNTIMDIIGARIPQRVDRLVAANYRRLELDCIKVWTTGTIVQVDPQTGRTFTTSFAIDAARITTAGTAWSALTSAYDAFIAWLEEAIDAVGGIIGVTLRLGTMKTILADAPNLDNGVKMSRSQLEGRIQDDIGGPFQFFLYEDSVDVFTDGGTAYARTKVFPDRTIAAVPVGGVVGFSAFAPVSRAFDIDAAVPNAGIDVNGMTVYHEATDSGKKLKIEAQVNALPVPADERIFVINIGVA